MADFGLAKLAGAPIASDVSGRSGVSAQALATAATAAGQIMGTPLYVAPEQVAHPSDVDHRADIYSLGVVFYQMLTGELPQGEVVPPSRKATVDVRLDEVVLRALERRPELRYQQVSEVKTMVETIAHEERVRVPSAPQPPPPVRAALPAGRAPARRPLGPVWLVATLHMIGLLVLVALLTGLVPRFAEMFQDFGTALPLFTRGVIAVSRFLCYGAILLLLVVLPVLGAVDWLLCWLAYRLAGWRLLAAWAVLGLLGQVALAAGIVGAVFLPMSQLIAGVEEGGRAPAAMAREAVATAELPADVALVNLKEETGKPNEARVPDAATAIALAVAAWTPLYGAEHLEKQKPYRATLSKGVWTVVGSLPDDMAGGVAEAHIAQADGRILRVVHGQ